MKLGIGETARQCHISVRTLQYYDRIGLLKPDEVTEAGYRLYGETAIGRLQAILYYRELEFSLKEIAEIMGSETFDAKQAIARQLELMRLKKKRIEGLIERLERQLKGEKEMDFKEFNNEEYEKLKAQHKQEARQRYGGTAEYRASQEREKSRSAEQNEAVNAEADEIFKAFAALKDEDPNCEKAQALVKRWQEHITRHHYECTPQILACLAQMYTADDRFKATLDTYAPGTATFMAKAIESYCKESIGR
ncbi:MAG: MerR family transcriptional regulator [Clostridia bacterium]|nr:MerR family transcriptional regulator [Clostridia bacterium]